MNAENYKIITLRSGNSGFQVCPEAGGVITRYWSEHNGAVLEWLWPASTEAIGQRNPLGMSCFPLVPFSGRIRNGLFIFQDQSVQLPLNFLPQPHAIHGHGWKQPWSVIEQSETKLIIEYRHQADAWPWQYVAQQIFELSERQLLATITVQNQSDSAMPAGLGFHPYLVRTPQASVSAEFDKVWLNDDEVMPLELVDATAERDLRNNLIMDQVFLDNTYTGWSRRAQISWPEWEAGLIIEAEAPLNYLVVYSPPGQKYFCVEPVSNVADAFNYAGRGFEDSGMNILQPGEMLSGVARFIPQQ